MTGRAGPPSLRIVSDDASRSPLRAASFWGWGGIALLAFTLRVWGNGWGLPNEHLRLRTLQPDEAHVLEVVARLRPGQLDFDPKLYEHPNFFIYLTAGWLGIGHLAGTVSVTADTGWYLAHPEATADLYAWCRLGSALLGTWTVLLLGIAARHLYGKPAALWTAAFAAVIPLLVVDAHYMKTDPAMLFFLSAALATSAAFLARGGMRWLWASAVSSALAGSCKYSAVMTVVIPLAALLCSGARGKEFFRRGLETGLACLATFAAANPFLVKHLAAGGKDVLFTFSTALNAGTLHLDLAFTGEPPGWIYAWTDALWYGAGPAAELAFLAALIAAVRRRAPGDKLVVAVWIVHVAVLGISWAQFVRYWGPLAAISCVFLGPLAAGAGRAGKILVALAWLYTAGYAAAMDRLYAREDPRFAASRWIEAGIPSGEPVARLRNPNYAGAGREFQLPPILVPGAQERARGIIGRHPNQWIEPDPAALAAPDRARWVVVSNYETRDYARLAERFPAQAAFVAGLESETGYRLRARFAHAPEFFGLALFPTAFPPHDWMYAWPEIRIYERR